jgi:hypothetical protein
MQLTIGPVINVVLPPLKQTSRLFTPQLASGRGTDRHLSGHFDDSRNGRLIIKLEAFDLGPGLIVTALGSQPRSSSFKLPELR